MTTCGGKWDRLFCCGSYGADREQEENGVRNSFLYLLFLFSGARR
jgi:hypothetical protein